ncbi:MAG: hypothetical protein AAF065_10200 [Verrucomicrobiota bacterium]
MEKSYQQLLKPVHHVIANALTLCFYGFMAFTLRPFTFSPDPLIAQAQACFAAFPVAATFWFAIYMFLVVLMDQLKQRAEKAE